MSGILYLIRHGEVDWNAENSYIGATDLPLNKKGERQAQKVAEYLRDKEITELYCSSKQRSFRTAVVIAIELEVNAHVLPEFDEANYGEWEGQQEQAVKQKYASVHALWQENPMDVRVPGGETFRELRDRVMPAFHRIADRHWKECSAIIAHKSVNRIILASLLGMDPNRYRQIGQGNACINEIELRDDGSYVVNSINFQAHLGR